MKIILFLIGAFLMGCSLPGKEIEVSLENASAKRIETATFSTDEEGLTITGVGSGARVDRIWAIVGADEGDGGYAVELVMWNGDTLRQEFGYYTNGAVSAKQVGVVVRDSVYEIRYVDWGSEHEEVYSVRDGELVSRLRDGRPLSTRPALQGSTK